MAYKQNTDILLWVASLAVSGWVQNPENMSQRVPNTGVCLHRSTDAQEIRKNIYVLKALSLKTSQGAQFSDLPGEMPAPIVLSEDI